MRSNSISTRSSPALSAKRETPARREERSADQHEIARLTPILRDAMWK